MTRQTDSFTTRCRKALLLAAVIYIAATLLIAEKVDHVIRTKELFYSWLLVLVNAYIGIFIANQALKRESGGFFAWALLGNGLRAGIFLMLLLSLVKTGNFHVRGFVLMSFFGYFTFLAVEIYGLQTRTKSVFQDSQKDE